MVPCNTAGQPCNPAPPAHTQSQRRSLHPSDPSPPCRRTPSSCPHAPLNSAKGLPFREIAFQSQPPRPIHHPNSIRPQPHRGPESPGSCAHPRIQIVPHRSHSSIFALRLERLATCTRRQPGASTPPRAPRHLMTRETAGSKFSTARMNPEKHSEHEPTSPTVTPHCGLPRNPRRRTSTSTCYDPPRSRRTHRISFTPATRSVLQAALPVIMRAFESEWRCSRLFSHYTLDYTYMAGHRLTPRA